VISEIVNNAFGAHPASYPVGAGGFTLRVKRPGLEADHSPLSSADVKKEWRYTSTPFDMSPWCGAWLGTGINLRYLIFIRSRSQ
jgi:hypothetical protein